MDALISEKIELARQLMRIHSRTPGQATAEDREDCFAILDSLPTTSSQCLDLECHQPVVQGFAFCGDHLKESWPES